MNEQSLNGTTVGPSTAYETTQSCGHRLPCGYCTLLNRVCPMGWSFADVTWKGPTDPPPIDIYKITFANFGQENVK